MQIRQTGELFFNAPSLMDPTSVLTYLGGLRMSTGDKISRFYDLAGNSINVDTRNGSGALTYWRREGSPSKAFVISAGELVDPNDYYS